ncbi:ABC transporter permease [Roseivirga sp. E12]|uniref:ABC transporter permease n=1 Tax=Roseivirga sp. E12 TaxID=2819237 RepID=UPI001ABC6E09|nr:ABC transporter permease [Roseivirga sp. E12]MBO3700665.1 ABC transporter permease [Roseivirga sp. E12]
MIVNYLKTFIRSFRRHPLLSTLNVLGLSIGIGCFLVISLYLFQENTYEKGFSSSENIYRIEEDFMNMGMVATTSSNLEFRLGDFPQVDAHTRVSNLGSGTPVIVEENRYKVGKIFSADSNYFKLFDYEFLVGERATALNGRSKVVLSEKAAITLFGTIDVLGKTITHPDFGPFNVSGVVKKSVFKSHLDFDVLFTSFFPVKYDLYSWYGINAYSYVKLKRNVTAEQLKTQLDELSRAEIYPLMHPTKELSFEEWGKGQNKVVFFAKPLGDIYLESNVLFEIYQNGDKQTRITLLIIAIFILFVASVNFMNLTTAKSSQRTKEIGVRKVLGASRGRLTTYFLTESLFITFLSTVLGAGLSELFIRLINIYWNGDIMVSLLTYPVLLVYLLIFVFCLGIMSGMYPALYLSSAKMIPLLKGLKLGRVLNLASAKTLRNSLVVLQFAISTTLIIGSIFISNQLKHLKELDLGFNKDQVMVIKNMPVLKNSRLAFKDELMRNAGVSQASFTHRLPADGSSANTSIALDAENSITLDHFYADEYFEEVLDLDLITGEWFDPDKQQYDSLIVINKTAAMSLGYDDAIGQVIGGYWTVIGVVDDFYYGGLRDKIGPAMFIYTPEAQKNILAAQIDPKTISPRDVERVWSQFTGEPFEYYYLNENYEGQIQAEQDNASAVLVFTVFAILISCLGLFGLAAFTADQRMHEFGVRKVLGANVSDIVRHFGGGFLKLILLAFVVAVPVAFYGINLWLEGFANRIVLSIWPFIAAGGLAVIIGIGTVCFQSFKTAMVNPATTLRNE